MEEKIKARILELEKERVEFLAKAEKQMLAYDVALGELQNLLKEDETPPT